MIVTTVNSRFKMNRDLTENWNRRVTFVPLEGEIIVYLDGYIDDNGNCFPRIKVGDGKAYVVDLPFIGKEIENSLVAHKNDTVSHITNEERVFWNNKLNAHYDEENLVLCNYELGD